MFIIRLSAVFSSISLSPFHHLCVLNRLLNLYLAPVGQIVCVVTRAIEHIDGTRVKQVLQVF